MCISRWHLVVVAFAVASLSSTVADGATRDAARPAGPASGALRRLPLAFEPNRGQGDPRARFLTRAQSTRVYFAEDGAHVALARAAAAGLPPRNHPQSGELVPWLPAWLAPDVVPSAGAESPLLRDVLSLRYRLAGATAQQTIEGVGPLPGRSNYFIGNDPGAWRTDVPHFRGVRYRDAQPGVDLVYYGNDGRLEFDIDVGAGVALADVRLRIDGAEALALDANGDLLIRSGAAEVVQRRPEVYQIVDGVRRERRGSYALVDGDGGQEVAFAVPDYDARFALVLDPVLEFGTWLGGAGNDGIGGLAIDGNDDIYVSGSTGSDNDTFPETVGAYQTARKGFFDVFVAKIKDDGSQLDYVTYIGGDFNEFANALAVDADGQAVVGGETSSDNYPTQNPAQASRTGGTCGLITKLNAAGNGLVFSTYLGGNQVSQVFAVAVDASGFSYATGRSIFNSSFPTTAGAFQTAVSGSGSDAFVVKYDSAGARVYATLLGAGSERGDGIAADDAGSAYVAGTIGDAAINGVTANLIGSGGAGDAMIAKVKPDGSGLAYLTRIGGTAVEQAVGVALDADGNAFFTGNSGSSDLPSTPSAPGGTYVALFGALNATGTTLTGPGLTWYGDTSAQDPNCVANALGGAFGASIALDPNNAVAYIAGYGCPVDKFPVLDPVGGLSCAPSCTNDDNNLNSFLLRYAYASPAPAIVDGAIDMPGVATFASLTSSSPIAGGMNTESFFSQVRTDRIGRPTLAGGSTAATLSTPNAIDATQNGGNDVAAFFPRFTPAPPLLTKRFSTDTIADGSLFTVTFTITNKNTVDVPLTGVNFLDSYPACIYGAGQALVTPPSCKPLFDAIVFPGGVNVKMKPGANLAAGQECTITAWVSGNGPEPNCHNVAKIFSDQGPGNSAADTVEIEPEPFKYWNRAGGQGPGNLSGGQNYVGGVAPVANDSVVVPAGTQTSLISDPPALPALHRVQFTGSGFTVSGGTLSLGGGVDNKAAGTNTISAPVKQTAPLLFTNEQATSVLNLSGGFDLAGFDAFLAGIGTTNVSGAISGTGQLNVTGNATITVNPTFTGTIDVTGLLNANALIIQPTTVEYGGLLRGTGSFTGSVTVEDGGTIYPGDGATPFTLPVNVLDIAYGSVGLRFSANNGAHSSLNVSGSMTIVGALKLDFGALPAANTTFSDLVTAPGTISGCFDEVRATPASVVAVAQCTATAVSVQVKAIDRLFAGSFDY